MSDVFDGALFLKELAERNRRTATDRSLKRKSEEDKANSFFYV